MSCLEVKTKARDVKRNVGPSVFFLKVRVFTASRVFSKTKIISHFRKQS